MAKEMRQPISVLVVDDEQDVLDAYRSTLASERIQPSVALNNLRAKLYPTPSSTAPSQGSSASFAVEYAKCAEEAINFASAAYAAGQPFSVVFLDMRMPPGPD